MPCYDTASSVRPHGWVSSWQHPACLRVPGVTKAELTTQIFGTEALKPEDLTFLIDTLCSDTAVALEEIDPNDPAFAKPEGPVPRLPPPAALTRPLLPFQEEGLGWMVANEASELKAGRCRLTPDRPRVDRVWLTAFGCSAIS